MKVDKDRRPEFEIYNGRIYIVREEVDHDLSGSDSVFKTLKSLRKHKTLDIEQT